MLMDTFSILLTFLLWIDKCWRRGLLIHWDLTVDIVIIWFWNIFLYVIQGFGLFPY